MGFGDSSEFTFLRLTFRTSSWSCCIYFKCYLWYHRVEAKYDGACVCVLLMAERATSISVLTELETTLHVYCVTAQLQ